jgi:hypothetical protein
VACSTPPERFPTIVDSPTGTRRYSATRSPPSWNTAPPKPTRCAPRTSTASLPRRPRPPPLPGRRPRQPASRRTLEADWNTALRALNDAQAAYDKARDQHPGQLTPEQKTRIRQLVTDLPGIWNDPATPRPRAKAHRPAAARRRHRDQDQDQRHHHRAPAAARRQHHTISLPVPKRAWELRQTPPGVLAAIDELLNTNTGAEIAVILNDRGLTSGGGNPYNKRRATPLVPLLATGWSYAHGRKPLNWSHAAGG